MTKFLNQLTMVAAVLALACMFVAFGLLFADAMNFAYHTIAIAPGLDTIFNS